MNCTATNRTFIRRNRHAEGMRQAVETCSIYLDCVLSDKFRYTNSRIKQIHASFNIVAQKVQNGVITVESLKEILKKEHNANIYFVTKRSRPAYLYSDYINGVYEASDKVSVILLYVLIHLYGFGEKKANKVVYEINEIARSVNQGYLSNEDIVRTLQDEECLEVKKLEDVE